MCSNIIPIVDIEGRSYITVLTGCDHLSVLAIKFHSVTLQCSLIGSAFSKVIFTLHEINMCSD